ncbi:MAG: hypothetical protein LBP85_09685 [Prevotellaceae bacterium]|jgi:hypothetical protein|nr:hypothetical protein [Prevotellaceae bacterium]
MEQITKFFKLIAGALIIIFCFLPFISFFGFGVANGFTLFSGNILHILSILLILAGAAVLIFVALTKDIEIIPKFSLSRIAKLSVCAGIILVFANLLSMLGIGLILVIIVTIVLFYEDKIIKALKK